jgi:hypothetical protein
MILVSFPGQEYALDGHPIFRRDTLLQIIQSKLASFFRDAVRHLFLPWMPVQDMGIVLLACSNIRNLWLNTALGAGTFPLVEDLPLKRLGCNLKSPFGPQRQIDFTHRIFQR